MNEIEETVIMAGSLRRGAHLLEAALGEVDGGAAVPVAVPLGVQHHRKRAPLLVPCGVE